MKKKIKYMYIQIHVLLNQLNAELDEISTASIPFSGMYQ